MFNLLNRVKRYFYNKLSNFAKPQMIKGFKRFDGVFLEKTRISNTTYIGSSEKLYIEDNVFIGHYNYIDASNRLTIGEGCQITNFVSILTHSSHISIRLYGKEYQNFSNLKGYLKGEVFIGAYSFIGPHSIIMPNVKIGKGCMVCAFSYVKDQFPDFSIIAGNPAKIVGDTRNLDETYLKENPELLNYYNQWGMRE